MAKKIKYKRSNLSTGRPPISVMTPEAVHIAVFTHGPQGSGPMAANFQGRHIKKEIEIGICYAEIKAVHD